jgi:hypothetical protein
MRTSIIMRDEYDFSAGTRGPVLKRPPQEGDGIVDLPIVCTLTPATVTTRKAALLPGLAGRADSREETASGIRLRLPADALSAIFDVAVELTPITGYTIAWTVPDLGQPSDACGCR